MIVSRLLGFTLIAVTALSAKIINTPRGEFRQAYALAHNGRVVVENLYGDVSITAWDRDEVLVEATKHSNDPRRLEEARIVVEPCADRLFIRTQYAGTETAHPASVEYRITVPRGARLDNIKLVNGGLSISGVAGPVHATSVNGGIKAQALAGEVQLSTVNGSVDANFNGLRQIHAISLSSVNGPIHLSLPPGAGASVDAHNRSGGIDTQFGHPSRASDGHRLHTVINRGGAEIQLSNINGGISIHSSWARRRAHSDL
jgi:DUF4097 and DUF4098 domain-containing protein YvlB